MNNILRIPYSMYSTHSSCSHPPVSSLLQRLEPYPSLATEIAAVHSTGPPPTTITSHWSSTTILAFFKRILNCEISSYVLLIAETISKPALSKKFLFEVIVSVLNYFIYNKIL